MEFQAIRQLVEQELKAVDNCINQHLASEIELVDELGHYITEAGGKRIRPLVMLLSANCFAYQGDKHILLAAITELIHTATLLHDDVVDESELRRGTETANAIWGNGASVLVGDFLFSRAFQMMTLTDNLQIMGILAKASNDIAAGEVMQLMNVHDPDTSEDYYYDVIKAKTATLFTAAARLGAMISNQNDACCQAMANYGESLGCAFQLVDDALDYQSDAKTMGKNSGDDLAEGKPTLPLIYALQHGSENQQQLIRQAIKDGGLENLQEVQQAVAETGAIEYTYHAAETQVGMAKQALSLIPDSDYRDALSALADFTLARRF